MVLLGGFVKLSMVHTDSPFPIFLGNDYQEGDPLIIWDRINKIYIQQILQLLFHNFFEVRIQPSMGFPNGVIILLNVDMMGT